MPVEDINQTKMAQEFLNTIQTAETTTEFWSNNNSLIAYFVLGVTLLGIFLFLLVLARYAIKKALR